MEYHITPYQPQYHERIIRIWERSVRATHHFLTEADLTYYTLLVQQMDFSCYSMLCAFTADGTLAGFAGTSGQQLDMLFLDPEYLGRGLGKALLTRCVEQQSVRRVEVNEQNHHAVAFYRRFGFSVVERKPFDDFGKPYPMLCMELNMGNS